MSPEQRGKHGNQKKIDPEIKQSVINHINSIPRIESHYCRAQTNREFIDGSKSVSELHRDYEAKREIEDKQAASYSMFNEIFKN
jgi:hypothetical protein